MLTDLRICGTAKHSVLDISNVLKSLGWAHFVHTAPTKTTPRVLTKIGEGPAKAFVANGVRSIRKRKGMIIVVDATSALSLTNLPIIPDDRSLEVALRGLPQLDRLARLEVRKPDVMDYVNSAVRPSFLTTVQTALYQVSNHGLRKTAQQAIIAHFNSKCSKSNLRAVLRSSYALDSLLGIMARPDVQVLRDAVTQYRKGVDIKTIERTTKCASFDIMYLVRSYDKAVSQPKQPKQRSNK